MRKATLFIIALLLGLAIQAQAQRKGTNGSWWVGDTLYARYIAGLDSNGSYLSMIFGNDTVFARYFVVVDSTGSYESTVGGASSKTLTLTASYPGESFKMVSPDTLVSCIVSYDDSRSYYEFSNDSSMADSLLLVANIPLPYGWDAWHTDSALAVYWYGDSGATLEIDIPSKYNGSSLTVGGSWQHETLTAANMGAYSSGDIIRLELTVKVYANKLVRLSDIILRYTGL